MTEQDKVLEALRMAMQMEKDGQTCYLEASRQSRNRLGKRLLKSIAAETDIHRQKFQKIYESVRARAGWPNVPLKLNTGTQLRADFEKTCVAIGTAVEAQPEELESLQTALTHKDRMYNFYVQQASRAASPAEGDLYGALAQEERAHYLVLLDYFEYLKDPAAWFTLKERHTLDGA